MVVSGINAEGATTFAAQHGAKARTTDAILSDPAIGAVLIATSIDTHSDLIERATAAGKAVLYEWPVDLSLSRAQACHKAVAVTGRPVMIGFNRRFVPNFAALKAALVAGEIDKAELLSITSLDPAPPPVACIKVSGGLLRDMMIHDFNMANFLMGAVPVSVSAIGSCTVDPAIGQAGDVDTAVTSGPKPTHFFLERYMPAHAAEWAAFLAAVNAGLALPVTLADGVAVLAMAEVATRSASSGVPVSLASVQV